MRGSRRRLGIGRRTGHLQATGDHAADGKARLRIARQRRVLHALPDFKPPRLFAVLRDRFVNVRWHGIEPLIHTYEHGLNMSVTSLSSIEK